ncbi:hypothetical protein JCM9279_006495 [Rhodotorula babjevae]
MPHVSDLPPELLLKVFSQLGSGSSYSDRERQRDLAGVAKVCRRFYAVSIPLLYGDSINVRSAGRLHCLGRTLEADPALAASVHDLVLLPTADQAHAPSALILLRTTPNLASLSLGAALFQGLNTPHMRGALVVKALRRFSVGFGGGGSASTSLDELVLYLVGWTQLEVLELHDVRVAPPAYGAVTLDRRLALLDPPAPDAALPAYDLVRLEVHGPECSPERTVWSFVGLKWLLGRSCALTALSLVDVTRAFPLPALFDELVRRGCGSTLRRLSIRRTLLAPHLSPDLIDPNDLASWFPSLTHLCLQDYEHLPSFAAPRPAYRPPSSLRVLELHGPFPKLDLNLVGMLVGNIQTFDGGQASLGKIRLVGTLPTSVHLSELRAACQPLGVVVELVWTFQQLPLSLS